MRHVTWCGKPGPSRSACSNGGGQEASRFSPPRSISGSVGFSIYHLRSPDGLEIWGKFVYREISPPEKLVYINSFSDPAGGTTRAPFFDGKWPLEILSTVTLAAEGKKTKVTINWLPYSATDIERKTFEEAASSMQQGWSGTLENLTDYLAAP